MTTSRSAAIALVLALATANWGCSNAIEDSESSDSAVVGVNAAAQQAAADLDALVRATTAPQTDDDRALTRVSAELGVVRAGGLTCHVHAVWSKGVDPFATSDVDTYAVACDDATFIYNIAGGVAWLATSHEAARTTAETFARNARSIDSANSDSESVATSSIRPLGLFPYAGIFDAFFTAAVESTASAMVAATKAAEKAAETKAAAVIAGATTTDTAKVSGKAVQDSLSTVTKSSDDIFALGTKVVRSKTEAATAGVLAYNETQLSRVKMQIDEALQLSQSYFPTTPPSNFERYGADAKSYVLGIQDTMTRDPQRWKRATQHLEQDHWGLPVTLNAKSERVVVVYHGGSIRDAQKFELSKLSDEGILGKGVYFSPDKAVAEDYAREALSANGQGRVIRLEIPADVFEGKQRVKLVAAPLLLIDGVQFDGPVIINLTGLDATRTMTYGTFTDMDFANSLVRQTVEEL